MGRRSELMAQAAVLASTLLWGTLWIPVRRLRALAEHGGSMVAAGFVIPLLMLLPVALVRGRRTLAALRLLGFASFWLALGIALYAEAVARGQIVRVILLFYLSPMWGTLLARAFLRQPVTARRLATIVLGLAGMSVIFGIDLVSPSTSVKADGMGLVAGFSWALAMMAFHRERQYGLFDGVFAQFVWLAPVYFLVTLLPGSASMADVAWQPSGGSLPWLLAFSLFWLLPVIALTVFAAGRMDSGRFAILLMFEIVVGLASAALLTDEPFGLREFAGAVLVMGAIAIEARSARVG